MFPLRSFALALLLAAAAPTALAGSFGVTPTRLQLTPDRRTGVVTLQNNAAEAVTVQVQTFAWPRTVATPDLEPTRELLALPAVFSLPPGGKQIIRVALRTAPTGNAEAAYRLLITEVPGTPNGAGEGVRFALRLSLPVFMTPGGAAPDVTWSTSAAGTKPVLQLANRGNAHLQVQRIVVRVPGREEPIQVIEEPAYILAGREQVWTLNAAALRHERLSLKAETHLGEIEATVVPSRG